MDHANKQSTKQTHHGLCSHSHSCERQRHSTMVTIPPVNLNEKISIAFAVSNVGKLIYETFDGVRSRSYKWIQNYMALD
jgi:hypothetical protein